MRTFIVLFIWSVSLFGFVQDSVMEAQVMQHCTTCHSDVRYQFNDFKKIRSHFSAPPMNLVIERLNEVIHITVDDEDVKKAVVTAYMKAYIEEPDMDRGLCHVSCFVQYGTMPSMKGTMSNEEMITIVGYLYDKYTR